MYAGWLSHCAGKCAHVRVESEKSRGVWRLAGKPIDFFSGQVCVREETDNPLEKKVGFWPASSDRLGARTRRMYVSSYGPHVA